MSIKSIVAGIVLVIGSTTPALAGVTSSVNMLPVHIMLNNVTQQAAKQVAETQSTLDAVHEAVKSIDEEEQAGEPEQVNEETGTQFVLADVDAFLQNKSNEPFKYDSINPVVISGISYCYGAVDAMYEQVPLEIYTSLSTATKKIGKHAGTIKSLVLAGHDDIIEMNSDYYSDMVFSKCNGIVHRVEVANE